MTVATAPLPRRLGMAGTIMIMPGMRMTGRMSRAVEAPMRRATTAIRIPESAAVGGQGSDGGVAVTMAACLAIPSEKPQ
jgi:hypothetical protein